MLAEPRSTLVNLHPAKPHYFHSVSLTAPEPNKDVEVLRKPRTSKALSHFALNISSSSAVVSDMNLSRPQDFVVTVFNKDANNFVQPAEPFDHVVDLSSWLHPQLECSIHQYAPHYFELCWFMVIDRATIKAVNDVIDILKPTYWIIFDGTTDGIQTELLKQPEDLWQAFNTSVTQPSECSRILTSMPLGKRCAGKVSASTQLTKVVEILTLEYFNLNKEVKTLSERISTTEDPPN
jgi:hypothetical protein